jgi:hypothetical protein
VRPATLTQRTTDVLLRLERMMDSASRTLGASAEPESVAPKTQRGAALAPERDLATASR